MTAGVRFKQWICCLWFQLFFVELYLYCCVVRIAITRSIWFWGFRSQGSHVALWNVFAKSIRSFVVETEFFDSANQNSFSFFVTLAFMEIIFSRVILSFYQGASQNQPIVENFLFYVDCGEKFVYWVSRSRCHFHQKSRQKSQNRFFFPFSWHLLGGGVVSLCFPVDFKQLRKGTFLIHRPGKRGTCLTL